MSEKNTMDEAWRKNGESWRQEAAPYVNGGEAPMILALAELGEEARMERAVETLKEAEALYSQMLEKVAEANQLMENAKWLNGMRLYAGIWDAEENMLRISGAKAALRGEDPAGIRRRKAREKSAGRESRPLRETGDADSSLRSE